MPTEVENALELRLALKKYMPDLAKETQAENWFKYLSKDLDLSEATIINNVNQLIV
jgi:hypothetical protein